MKLSPQLKINLKKVAVITCCYILFNLFITFFINAILNSPFSLGPSPLFIFKSGLITNTISGIVGGILGGTSLVLINSRLFQKKSFRYALFTTAYLYVLVFSLITISTNWFFAYGQLGNSATILKVTYLAFELMVNQSLIAFFIIWGGVTLLTLFLLQVNDKFGPGILLKFIMGKYYQPKKEERFFMFLDMKSSTTIAEKIGNEWYFSLLSNLFSHITNTILNHEGEIYQYVGDEIVISWPLKKGIKNANSLNCFTQIQKKLLELAPFYEKKYGLTPQFKAGLHYGQVMAGEIGVIKRDIIYSGDVLNTAARIQEQCNVYDVDFLVSDDAFNLIQDKDNYKLIPIGSIELRGKEQKISINTVKLIN